MSLRRCLGAASIVVAVHDAEIARKYRLALPRELERQWVETERRVRVLPAAELARQEWARRAIATGGAGHRWLQATAQKLTLVIEERPRTHRLRR